MNLLKIILSTSAFAIASVALHAQLPTKVESFPVRDVWLTEMVWTIFMIGKAL